MKNLLHFQKYAAQSQLSERQQAEAEVQIAFINRILWLAMRARNSQAAEQPRN